ncbi:MAG: RnfABCDGE type electron transport complex subunit B [Treponema sp.]|nr:RnfABCDGE type electron transport complex subunit B [Treponema sp.]
MSIIITAVVSVTIIGIICAIILNVASQLMFVKTDERITKLTEIMPGVNCGACGYPGCSSYAEALVNDNVSAALCTPGGVEVLNKISELLGVEAGAIEQKTAVIKCAGDFNTRQQDKIYLGIQSCGGAHMHFGGDNSCVYGCLGYGDCQKVCPASAVYLKEGLAHINHGLCTGCSLCVKACPKKLIAIEKSSIPVIIACSNTEKGAVTRKKCSSGCIACGKCVRECPVSAISMENNLAIIDYEKCNGCLNCVKSCVTKCITSLPFHR